MTNGMKTLHAIILPLCAAALAAACAGGAPRDASAAADTPPRAVPDFNADSAHAFCAAQCAFGPRVMNSGAHDSCAQWIAGRFRGYGLSVSMRRATLVGYDGTPLNATNITARLAPDKQERVLLCAHYDSRPWADNDPDTAKWRSPVPAANDGASGVAVMLELARILSSHDSLNVGVDFVCFDAEDYGAPRWSGSLDDDDSWALGSQHWARLARDNGYAPRFGILLDMVGGQGATFYQETFSLHYANDIVKKVWDAARRAGYSAFFPKKQGGMITDDHVPLNETAGIPTIDIVPHHPDCPTSSFGATWHTVSDDMGHIDRNTLKAVGQTLVLVVCSE